MLKVTLFSHGSSDEGRRVKRLARVLYLEELEALLRYVVEKQKLKSKKNANRTHSRPFSGLEIYCKRAKEMRPDVVMN
jgi:hypothetical protein